jgi:hypothetical protein
MKRILVAEAVVMVAVVVVHQVTEVVDPREAVLDRACVNVQAVAPLPAPVLAPNHHGGVLVLTLSPSRLPCKVRRHYSTGPLTLQNSCP